VEGIGSPPVKVFVLTLLSLVSGCASTGARARIQAQDPGDRVRAIIQAAEQSDRQAIPLIIDRLEDEDEAVRTVAALALRKLTNQDLGYRPYDSLYRRTEAIERWHQWLAESKMNGSTTRPATTEPAEQAGP